VLVAGVTLGLLLAVLSLAPLGPSRSLIPIASAHAFLIKSDPAANAILQSPPSKVRLWYSEDLNPLTSRAVVVDPGNRQVDNKDSHVTANNSKEMDVSLPLLPAGTYVVAWRAQSADDGHVTGGSFIFRIARPDGSVPPVPHVLPTGHFPGAAGVGSSSNGFDGPSLFQAISTWLALLLMTFWAGGLIWETWILPPGAPIDPDLRATSLAAGRRFQRMAPYALVLLLVADIGLVLAEGALLAGDWSGMFSLPLLSAVLFGSRFGTFWWMRQIVALAALALTLFIARRDRLAGEATPAATLVHEASFAREVNSAIPDWRRELIFVLRGIPRLPRRLVEGVQRRDWASRILCLLGLALVVAFALSGHAAAVPATEFAYAIAVDLFHMLCNVAWLGGLLYIGVVLIPTLRTLPARLRARVLALGLPQFSALAIICALLLTATGSLNATIRLTSWTQLLTTTYGRTLAVKTELFLVMVAISAYHAFILRPRLARELGLEQEQAAVPATSGVWMLDREEAQTLVGAARAGASSSGNADEVRSRVQQERDNGNQPGDRQPKRDTDDISPRARSLEERLREWLRREAWLGGAVLLCVALLGIFAGSLAPNLAAIPSNGPKGPFVATQTVNKYAVTMKVSPAIFGTNTFTVTITTPQGQPLAGAGVVIETSSLDMDMGTQTTQLKEVGSTAPGSYSGQADITMAGHWQVVVRILLPHSPQPLTATFQFSATY
jgi:copper transport protein